MTESVGTLTTKVVSDESKTHVYEICREFDTDGEEIILITLYPTLTEPNTFDLSSVHLMNHASDEGLMLKKVHFVFLFSKVVSAKLSTRGLKMDESNMQYLRDTIKKLPKAKIIISFGSSMHNCPAVIESKVELFKIIKELRSKDALWQIDAEGMDEDAPHILFAGIRYGNLQWGLRHYIVPYRYTEEGYQSYLTGKEAARERFVQNVLGRKKDEVTASEEKPKKGKKKNENKESE